MQTPGAQYDALHQKATTVPLIKSALLSLAAWNHLWKKLQSQQIDLPISHLIARLYLQHKIPQQRKRKSQRDVPGYPARLQANVGRNTAFVVLHLSTAIRLALGLLKIAGSPDAMSMSSNVLRVSMYTETLQTSVHFSHAPK